MPRQENENDLQFAWRSNWRERVYTECNISEEDLPIFLNRIEATGLIEEVVGMYLGYLGGEYRVTKSFVKLMEYIDH